MFLAGHILLVLFFSLINLIVAYPLNENKHQLLASFESSGWEAAKQLLNFLAVFEPKPLIKKRVATLFLFDKYYWQNKLFICMLLSNKYSLTVL